MDEETKRLLEPYKGKWNEDAPSKLIKKLEFYKGKEVLIVFNGKEFLGAEFKKGIVTGIEKTSIAFKVGKYAGISNLVDIIVNEQSEIDKLKGELQLYHFGARAGEEDENSIVLANDPYSAFLMVLPKCTSKVQTLEQIEKVESRVVSYHHNFSPSY